MRLTNPVAVDWEEVDSDGAVNFRREGLRGALDGAAIELQQFHSIGGGVVVLRAADDQEGSVTCSTTDFRLNSSNPTKPKFACTALSNAGEHVLKQ